MSVHREQCRWGKVFFKNRARTARDDDPDEVHEEVVTPEVIRFWSAIRETLVIVVKHARSVVEDVAVYLTKRD